MADPSDNSAEGDAPSAGNSSTAGSVEGKVPTPVGMPDFSGGLPHATDSSGIGVLGDVSLQVRIELGRTKMLVEDVLKLNPDSVVELDKAAGDPVDIYVNGRRIARGEVLVLNENFCVRVSEILEPYESHA
jgi:flagellar motor switch protein FliN/FliY